MIFFNHKVFNIDKVKDAVETVDMLHRNKKQEDYNDELLDYYPNINEYVYEFGKQLSPKVTSELKNRKRIIESTYNVF